MAQPTLIGVTAPQGRYTAGYLRYGDDPARLAPMLRRIWTTTFARDTGAMAATLLAHSWSTVDADADPGTAAAMPRGLVVPGVGIATVPPTGLRMPRTGRLHEHHDGVLEWLYLLDATDRVLLVYEATCHDRWLRHSYHHLDPVEDLFVPEPGTTGETGEMTVCTVCGAVDEIDHQEFPSMARDGYDTCTACLRCGSSVTTTPMFGAHTTRKAWPPYPACTPRRADPGPDTTATTARTTRPRPGGTD